ncbi:MAG: adenosylcobinamide-GDP ribazoletransferase, partial [Chitinophagaceae bacterium]|nr:adenosylcobinamide-GDP ribazoletransferase [Rubrivivax sp.]
VAADGLLVAALAVAVTTATMARWLQQRLQGFTGDTLGATQQFCELAVYLAALAALSRG